MSQLKAEEAVKEFERGQFRPVYLFYGEETFLFDELVGLAKRKLTPPGLEDFNFNKLDGATADPRDVAAAAQTLPFMADKRLVVVAEARFFRPGRRKDEAAAEDAAEDGAGDGPAAPAGQAASTNPAASANRIADEGGEGGGEQALLDYLADPSPTTCLIFAQTSDRERRLADPDRRRKPTKAVEKAGALVQCARLKDWQAARWAADRAKAAGKKLDQSAALELVHTVGEDLRTVASELGKLVTYAGEDAAITIADINVIASPTAERRVWDLLDALGYRRRGDALGLLRALYRQGVYPLAVMGLITVQLRRLLKTRALLDAGKDPSAVAAAMGLQPFLATRLIEQARGFTAGELTAALTRVFETDLRIKTTEVDPAMAVELLLLELV